MLSEPSKKSNLEKAIKDYAFVSGCTHPMADNFNPSATIDDGSCKDPYDIRPELRCSGNGLIFNVPDGCLDDGGKSSQGDSLQVYCCNEMARFCLSGEACQWRGGCPSIDADNHQTCSRSGLGLFNDWMATAKCNFYNGLQMFYCNEKGDVRFSK